MPLSAVTAAHFPTPPRRANSAPEHAAQQAPEIVAGTSPCGRRRPIRHRPVTPMGPRAGKCESTCLAEARRRLALALNAVTTVSALATRSREHAPAA